MVTFVGNGRYAQIGSIDDQAYSSSTGRLADGGFVAIDNTGTSGTLSAILYDADGQRVGSPIMLTSQGGLSDVVPLSTGGFAVAWEQGTYPNFQIVSQVFDRNGTAVTSAQGVSATGLLGGPKMATVGGDHVVIEWKEYTDSFATQSVVKTRVIDASNAAITSINNLTSIAVTNSWDVIKLTGGTVLTQYGSFTGGQPTVLHVAPFGPATNAPSGGDIVTLTAPSDSRYQAGQLVALTSGDFVLAWYEAISSTSTMILHAQVYNAAGTAQGQAISISNPGSDFSVTALDSGGFALAYPPTSSSLLLRVYDAAGNAQGGAQQVNDPTHLDLSRWNITAFGTDDIAVAYSYGSSNPDTEIKLFYSVTAGTAADETINGTSSRDVLDAMAGNDILSGLGGSDLLLGGAGNDILTGGPGVDTLTGGAGNDIFRDTAAGLNGDTITDFAIGDTILVTDATFAGFTFALSGQTLTYSGGSVTLTGFTIPAGYQLKAQAAPDGGVALTLASIRDAQSIVHDDFNGDGRSDILWRNVDGHLTDWLATASGGFGGNAAANALVGTDWKIAGTGDFNGDGRADILWRNDNGQLTDWLGQTNGGHVGNAAANASVGTDWKIVGTGDFNGDGRSDILWRNDNGQLTTWLAHANSDGGFAGNAAANALVGTDWKIVGTGDFNGDGRDDILWRNDNGQLTDWIATADGGFVGNAAANTSVGTDWKIVGTGDFNGDGRDDILWRNDNGQLTDWIATANGGFVGNAAANASVGTDWKIAGTGDYDGDGRDDILWRNANGQLTDWLAHANGDGGFFGNASANAAVSTDWLIAP